MIFWAIVAIAIVLVALEIRKRFTYTYETTKNYTGKNIIVTGASSGIGEGLALKLAKLKPAHLVLCARRIEKLEQVKEAALKLGAKNVTVMKIDVSRQDDCQYVANNTIV